MNYYERHLGDYAKDTAHLTMLEHGAYGLLLDRYYSTEAGIPADQAYRITRAQKKDEKKSVDVVLSEFFSLVDGVWINRRADAEIAKYQAKLPDAEAKKENDRERQKRARDRRKSLFDQLRSHGITAPWDATTEQLQDALSRANHEPVTQPVTCDNTANHTPDTSHQAPVKPSGNTHASTVTTHSDDLEVDGACSPPDPQLEAVSPTLAGAACLAMRKAGLADANPSHPTLLALLDAGATTQELAIAAGEASSKGKGFAYAIGTVKRRREEAARLVLHQGKLPNKQEALEANNRAVGMEWERKMREQMGVENAS